LFLMQFCISRVNFVVNSPKLWIWPWNFLLQFFYNKLWCPL
jgi:hypothetical protein